MILTNVEVLFDLENDPLEMNNLLGSNPKRFEHKEKTKELRSKLVSYLRDVDNPIADEIEKKVFIRN